MVLYGPSVASAAVDLESKFSEAALGNVQLADLRNFAHGRHHWIAKRGPKTGVLAIYGREESNLAERTLRLIPPSVPVARIGMASAGPLTAVAALVAVLHLVGMAGRARGIDPGKPGVPEFGRRIYGLGGLGGRTHAAERDAVAIARKLGKSVDSLSREPKLEEWRGAYQRYLQRLANATYGAVLFDFDGTLCDERDRFSGLRSDVSGQLTRLLNRGMIIGVATGRGRSVKTALRGVLAKPLWRLVHLGYYNGADIAGLEDDAHPQVDRRPAESIRAVSTEISNHTVISGLVNLESRHKQVAVQTKTPASATLVWQVLQELAQRHGLQALRSSHSIDLVGRGVSKRALTARLEHLIPKGSHVLVIGDKGVWPGNDFDLLSDPFSLSVDEVSADPDSCWNLAPSGHRGVQATLGYLSALRPTAGLAKMDPKKLLAADSAVGAST
jgi:hydroxymethylpyrimidine pyrophosphatase-like HAD family hydrolase